MRIRQVALALVAVILSAPLAPAQVSPQIASPQIGGVEQPPYGPGFDGRVIVGPRDGCRNYDCPPTDLQNRPAHRRYYDNYFDVPRPRYSSQRPLHGDPALDPAPPPAQRCAARYRSYRASDNTFQPVEGPRRACEM